MRGEKRRGRKRGEGEGGCYCIDSFGVYFITPLALDFASEREFVSKHRSQVSSNTELVTDRANRKHHRLIRGIQYQQTILKAQSVQSRFSVHVLTATAAMVIPAKSDEIGVSLSECLPFMASLTLSLFSSDPKFQKTIV